MKLPMFSNIKERAEWAANQAELVRTHGLAYAREEYRKALEGEGKERWFEMNNIPNDTIEDKIKAEQAWEGQLAYLRDNVSYLEKKVKEYEKLAAQK